MQQRADRYFEEHKPFAGLGRASLKSGLLMVSARLVNVLVQVGSMILLAHLLEPRDFGLATMVLALTLFAPFFVDLGTTDAASQKTRITRQEISTLFWLNLAIGITMTALFAGASGLIAEIFAEPELVGIALVSSLTFVLTGLYVQHYALMRRAMEFEKVALIDFGANFISSVVAIIMALTGWSYWALVVKPLVTLAVSAVGAWLSCPWIPGRPKVDGEVRHMIRFGLGVTGFAVTDQVTRSADKLAIGYLFGPGPLGQFQNAFLLYANLIGILTESLHNVAISGLSKLRSDPAALRRSWAAALSVVSFTSTAAFATVAVTGEDIVVLLLGEKWAPAGPLLCVLGLRGIAHGVERSLGWLHIVAGRSDRWMRWGVFSAVCHLAALAAGLPYGLMGVAIAYAAVTFALFVPALAYAGQPLGIGVKDVLSASGPQVASGLLAAAVAYAFKEAYLDDLSPLVRIAISVPICISAYLAAAVGLFRVTEPLRLALSLITDVKAKRKTGLI